MITAVHIEDEPRNVELLQTLLNSHCSELVQMKGAAANLQDAFSLIKKENPELVFLDIELNRGNAFELLDKINNSFGINFEVIFITAFNEYAIKAFRLNAIDYLLKPISITDLKQAVNKALEKINNIHSKSERSLAGLLQQLQDNIAAKKIGIVVAEGVEFVKPEDIIKIEARGSYCIVYLKLNKKITSTKGMKEIEDVLPVNTFLRVHNTWIINTQHLKKYTKGRNGFLEMEDGSSVPISIRKKGSFLDSL